MYIMALKLKPDFLFPAGETGLGKSTLMDTLFNTQFENVQAAHSLPGVQLKANTYGEW